MTVNPPAGLKYSDYADAITITSTGLLAMSANNLLISAHPQVQAGIAIIAFISATLGRWLQSKGD